MIKPIGNKRTDNIMYNETKAGTLWVTQDSGFKFYDNCAKAQERV